MEGNKLHYFDLETATQLITMAENWRDTHHTEMRPEVGKLTGYLQEQMQGRSAMTVEGPPVYLFQSDDLYPGTRLSDASVVQGWQLTHDLMRSLQTNGITPQHHLLIDDHNYQPEGYNPRETDPMYLYLSQYAAQLGIPVLTRWHRANLESMHCQNEGDQCSTMDASFQNEKFYKTHEKERVLHEPGTALHVVVHPGNPEKPSVFGFATQQIQMMDQLQKLLRRKMTGKKDTKTPKAQALIADYRHLWIDQSGDLCAVTQPSWVGSKFIHSPIDL